MSTVLGFAAGTATSTSPASGPATGAHPRRAPSSPKAPDGPPLQVVPRPVGLRRAPSMVAMVLLVAAGLVGLLMLNTAMQRRAFELTELDARADALDVRVSALTLRTDRLESTAHLASRAARLGMVENPSPVFLQLSDRSVIGDPVPATAASPVPGSSGPDSSVPGLDLAAPPAVAEPQRSPSDAPTGNPPASAAAGEDEATVPVPDDARSAGAGEAVADEETGEGRVQQR